MLTLMEEAGGRVALVAGGSGLVGSALLPLLLGAREYARVHALSRRALPIEHARLANRVVRFDAPLESQLKGLKCQDAFCCLGTTLRAAGSTTAFRAVDHDLVIAYARAALALGAERFVLVSSVGANARARNLYLRVKGEVELAVERLRFGSLQIMQPSLLMGMRRERRPLELIAQPLLLLVAPLLLGPWARYRPISAAVVAAAMLTAARSRSTGLSRYTYPGLRRLAGARGGPSPL
jgi:uncharacterized protein YbjT (DUF2867 family)